jgi:hypothetical protein
MLDPMLWIEKKTWKTLEQQGNGDLRLGAGSFVGAFLTAGMVGRRNRRLCLHPGPARADRGSARRYDASIQRKTN